MRQSISVAALLLVVVNSAAAQSPPPPPPYRGAEFFNPVLRSHSVEARCAGSVARAVWEFDGHRSSTIEITFNNQPLHPDDVQLVNGWAAEMQGDFFVWVECGREAAGFKLIQANAAGTSGAKQVRFDLINGRIRFVRRLN